MDEIVKLENEKVFFFKNIKKDIVMTKEVEEVYRIIKICRFCEKENLSDKKCDHCHSTCKHRSPAHSIFNFNVTQKQSNFIPFIFHNFSNYDCHLLLKKLVD